MNEDGEAYGEAGKYLRRGLSDAGMIVSGINGGILCEAYFCQSHGSGTRKSKDC